jgi:DNA-binding CsgD family transcriptional regulator
MHEDLVDSIYECAFVPENWPRVLADASKLSGSAGASLFVTAPGVVAWTASRNVQGFTGKFVRDGWYWRGDLMNRVHASRHPGFVRDIDICSPAELAEEPIYRDSWGKAGVGYGAATAFTLPNNEALSIVLPRNIATGPADAEEIGHLDELRPHLGRAALIAARMRLERAKAAGEALAAIGLAGVVLEQDGRVLAANDLIQTEEGHVQWRAGDRFALQDDAANDMLHNTLARFAAGASAQALSFPVRNAVSKRLYIGHVIPVRLTARDIFSRSVAVFVLAPVAAPGAPSAELIRSLFDLTPAEARVARGLAGGKTVEDLAADGGVSSNTVRAQVRGVLEKTGCRRQTDVVALLAGLSAVRPGR